MIKNLHQKLKFIELMDKMKEIERAIYLKYPRRETDAEHSFHLAMMVITFAQDFPELDIEKALKFALVHDIVEIYAWDTVVLVDVELLKTKEKREREALERLEKEFWEVLPDFIQLIKDYESKKSEEAKFVYSLDKIQPIIQIVMEWWQSWHNWKYDYNKVKNRAYKKIYPQFWLDKILDIYFEKAEKEKIYYNEK